MKTKLFTLLLTLAMLLALGGCSLYDTAARLDAAEDRIEDRLDAAEDRLEDPIRTAAMPETALTEDEVVTIALEHAGLTRDQISGLRVQYEIDDRVPEYEIEFRQGLREYEYTIHAETGEILSYNMDD